MDHGDSNNNDDLNTELDRDRLLRLIADEVSNLSKRIGVIVSNLASPEEAEGNIFRFEPAGHTPQGEEVANRKLGRRTRPALPDPLLIRKIIRKRQLRARYFGGDIFADPAWDMLLDLTAARAQHTRVSVTSLCIASGVPPTTALRWISVMSDAGLVERVEDDADRRRVFVVLTNRAAAAIARYFAEIGSDADLV